MAKSKSKLGWRKSPIAIAANVAGVVLIAAFGWFWGYALIRAEIAWSNALAYFEQDDMFQAKRALEECVAYWPNDAEVHFYLARACRRISDESGKEHLRLAEKLGWPKEAVDLEMELITAQYESVREVENALYSVLMLG